MNIHQFEDRKREHIRHALDPSHQALGLSGLGDIHLQHEALPDLNLEEIQLQSSCLSHSLATPFFIAGMTAGHADAAHLNRTLALACQSRGWAMGVGSQRRELEAQGKKDLLATQVDSWSKLRDDAPDLILFANLGISQLLGTSIAAVRRLVESISAQALVIHLNALQESIQPEGTPSFRGAFDVLKQVCEEIGVPVVVKETGCGFSKSTLKRLAEIGLSAVDVSGLGGTHWGRIEGARAKAAEGSEVFSGAAETFAEWGESTVDSVLAAREVLGKTEIWASGGVRNGLDAAKLIALGAHRVGYAKPALEAAIQGSEALDQWMLRQEYELRVALFCTGCSSTDVLRHKEGVWKRKSFI